MFSTTVSPLPHMMAHASSADAPFDSEVSTADLDSEAFVTTPSATPPSTTTTTTSSEALQLDLLSKLLQSSSTSTSTSTSLDGTLCVSSPTSLLLSDPSIIALTQPATSSTWTATSSISPLVLKLESPLLTSLDSKPALSRAALARTTARARASRAKANDNADEVSTPSSLTTTEATVADATEADDSKGSSNSTSGRRKSTKDPVEKEAKARERVLRNRAAAQESRDKKRKYVSEIEESNEALQVENTQLLKRLKTVESDNQALSQRLEALTAQFAQMQQLLLSQSVKHQQPQQEQESQLGAGFCQSAVLAKKDKMSPPPPLRSHHYHSPVMMVKRKSSGGSGNLTNSPQQRLAPFKKNLHNTISKTAPSQKHRQHLRDYSMTMRTLMSKDKGRNREARLLDQSAAQNWTETSCRSFCNNNTSCRNRTSTLSSSVAASFLAVCPSTLQPQPQQQEAVFMMALLCSSMLHQLMLTFSTLFLISTGVQSSTLQELQLQQVALSFIQQQRLPPLSTHCLPNLEKMRTTTTDSTAAAAATATAPRTTIKDQITSLDSRVVEEIVSNFRQGHREVARGLLVKALLSRRTSTDPRRRLDKDEKRL